MTQVCTRDIDAVASGVTISDSVRKVEITLLYEEDVFM